jgi:hypothetical protein
MTDKFNADDYRFEKLEDDAPPKDLSGQTTTAQAYQDGLRYLSLNGYRLVPDMAGQFAFHRAYRLAPPSKVKGINYPDGFKFWKEVASQSEIATFQSVVQDYINASFEERTLWMPIIQPDMAKRKPLYSHAQSLVSLEATARKQETKPISYGVDPYPRLCQPDESTAEVAPRAYVPLTEWFDPKLAQLTLADLLSLFPEAEHKLLALCIGRAVVGRSGAQTPSGLLVKHTSRMAAMVLGKDPGLGKSTLFDKLWSALESVGYIVETFSKMGARFNLGPVATADIIYKDDITSKGLQAFVESENTKIIITGNGLLKVEDKGTNAVNVQPCGVIFLNTNEFNSRVVYGIDPGTADRLKILSTLRASELDQQKVGQHSAYPEHLFPALAQQLNVSETAIMLWLARLCADYFWEHIQPAEENLLKREVHYWTHRLRVPLHKNATAQVLSLFTFLAIGDMNPKQLKKFLTYDSRQDISVQIVNWKKHSAKIVSFICSDRSLGYQAYLRWHFETVDPTNEYHPYLGLRILSGHYLKEAYLEVSQTADHPDNVCCLFEHLKLAQGLPLSKDIVWLNESWQTITPQIKKLAQLWEDMDEVVDNSSIDERYREETTSSPSFDQLNHQLALEEKWATFKPILDASNAT